MRNAHTAYIHAGADIITTNTFNTARHVLEPAGYGEDVALLNRRAVELAREARNEAAARDVWIAGSLSCVPPHSEFRNGTPSDAKARDNYREQASILAEAGVDLLITEMMLDPQNAALVTEAAREMDLPVWNGMSAQVSDDGIMMAWRGRVDLILSTPECLFEDVVKTVVSGGCQVAGVMHTRIADFAPALEIVKRHWTGPLMAYAETGHYATPKTGSGRGPRRPTATWNASWAGL